MQKGSIPLWKKILLREFHYGKIYSILNLNLEAQFHFENEKQLPRNHYLAQINNGLNL